jgi:hypothetical protein
MPWRHAFLPQGTTSQTAKAYEVDRIGLPRLVLVAPDGKVAAVQPDLSPELIDHTLGYYLGSAPGLATHLLCYEFGTHGRFFPMVWDTSCYR